VDESTVLSITIARDGSALPRVSPAVVTLDVDAFGLLSIQPGHYRLRHPAGWSVAAQRPLAWDVRPVRVEPDREAKFTLERLSPLAPERSAHVRLELDLRNSIDPAPYALPLRNRASELGEVRPRREIFARTFLPLPEPIARLLFTGLYADIVYLRSGPGPRGGMCSGMARWTIARAAGVEPLPPSTDVAVGRIAMFHGRQLRDRALLSALPWFVRGSSAAAFRAVRRDLIRDGRCDRALDIAVPKLWRRDLPRALVREGHTVVPYRLRQEGHAHGAIEIYDPNHPGALGTPEPRTIHFDLLRNRYAYGTHVRMEETNVGMIAVRQSAYAERGTAFLAVLGSLVLSPRRALRSVLGRQHAART
jgi:hypothetical protein